MIGVLPTNSGHCTAIPGAVTPLWEPAIHCANVRGTAPATMLPTPCTFLILSSLQAPRAAWARPSDAAQALTRSRPRPAGPSERCHATPEGRTLHSNRHAARRSHKDAGAIFARPRTTPRMTARPAPHSPVRHSVLSTVARHCTPPIRGRTTTSPPFRTCTPPLLVSIKGDGGLCLIHLGRSPHLAQLAEPICSSEPRYWHSPQSTSPLAETWELLSLSRLACTPYYRHLQCKIIQCPRTPPCWTYGPAAGTRITRAFLCCLLH